MGTIQSGCCDACRMGPHGYFLRNVASKIRYAGTHGASGVLVRYIALTTSTYGDASLTKRAPRLLTRMPPGSDFSMTSMRACGSPGTTVVGPHHASSIRSSAAPADRPRLIASPVLWWLPHDHSARVGFGRYLSRIAWFDSKPPAESRTPLGGADAQALPLALGDDADHAAVLDDEFARRRLQPQRYAAVEQRGAHHGDERVAHRQVAVAPRLEAPRQVEPVAAHQLHRQLDPAGRAGQERARLEHGHEDAVHDEHLRVLLRIFRNSSPSCRASKFSGSMLRPPGRHPGMF